MLRVFSMISGIFPKDRVAKFQGLLLIFLGISLSASLLGTVPFAIAFAALGASAVAYSFRLQKNERPAALLLVAAFAFFSIVAHWMRLSIGNPFDMLLSFPALALGFLAFFIILKLAVMPWEAECEVLGYSEGLAIVQTKPSIAGILQPGRYVVDSEPVRRGQRGRLILKRTLFGQPTPKSLEIEK
jgi:hypothetical protein